MEKFFKNKMRERLNRLEINYLKLISEIFGVSSTSKKNKTQIIDDICSVCFVQDEYNKSLSIDYEAQQENFFNFPLSTLEAERLSWNYSTGQILEAEKPKLIDYTLEEHYTESRVRAGSSVTEYKIVGKDGKERKPEEFNELIRKEREVVKYYGFIEKIGEQLMISAINSGEHYDILDTDLDRWHLELYDTVGFNRYWSSTLNKYQTQIISVNGRVLGEDCCRKNLDVVKKIKPYREFDFSNDNNICTLLSAVNPIRMGDRILISTSENNGKRRIAMEIAKAFKKLGNEVFSITTSSIMDEVEIFEDIDKNATLIDSKSSPIAILNKVSIAFMRAVKFVEEGKDVVVILGDTNECCENINKYIGQKSSQFVIKYLESIFSCGGQYEGGGSMTIVSVAGIDDEILLERLKFRVNFYAPLKDADTSLYPQVDFKQIRINSRETF